MRSARLARLRSASIIARSTATVESRSSHNRIGNDSARARLARRRGSIARAGPPVPSMLERQADDDAADCVLLGKCAERFGIRCEFAAHKRLKRRSDARRGIAKRKADGFGAKIEAERRVAGALRR